MNTRMEKYSEEPQNQMSRTSRHSELYKTINKSNIDNYEIKSNATVLGSNNKNNIDVEQIKKILDMRYKDTPRRSIRIETEEVTEEKKEEITKEYDINAILEKAKSDKPISYEEERAKKLRDTQYDILNNLNVESEQEDEPGKEEAKLLDLINTITINESKNKVDLEADNDLFSDLKGDEHTEVLSGMKEEIEKTEKQELKKENTISLDNTAFSKSLEFSKSDFEDLDVEDKTSPLAKILIAIIVIIFLVVVFFFLKAVFNF